MHLKIIVIFSLFSNTNHSENSLNKVLWILFYMRQGHTSSLVLLVKHLLAKYFIKKLVPVKYIFVIVYNVV